MLPLALAVIPFGLILGANAAAKGLSPAEAVTMSALVFAGSAQFVAISLWSDPAPWLALAGATLLLNLRHVLMGASLASRLGGFGPVGRCVVAFFMADEVWAVAERRALTRPLTPAFYAGAGAPLYLSFVLSTGLGASLGALIHDPRAWGFDFAFTAVFIGLVAGFWRGRPSLAITATSGLVAIVAHRLLPGAWYVLAGALAGVAAAALVPPPQRRSTR